MANSSVENLRKERSKCHNKILLVSKAVKLRDGFSNNTVSITMNGKEVYRKSGVSTDLTISFADAVEVAVEEPVVKLEVAVEDGHSATKEIRVQETPFVDVSIIEGRMQLRESKDEVPML